MSKATKGLIVFLATLIIVAGIGISIFLILKSSKDKNTINILSETNNVDLGTTSGSGKYEIGETVELRANEANGKFLAWASSLNPETMKILSTDEVYSFVAEKSSPLNYYALFNKTSKEFNHEGINYLLYEDAGLAEVTDNKDFVGKATLPSIIKEKKIYCTYSIQSEAFKDSLISSLNIPEKVINIGKDALANCESLLEVTIESESISNASNEDFLNWGEFGVNNEILFLKKGLEFSEYIITNFTEQLNNEKEGYLCFYNNARKIDGLIFKAVKEGYNGSSLYVVEEGDESQVGWMIGTGDEEKPGNALAKEKNEIFIPATFKGLPVVAIGNRAFQSQEGIERVELGGAINLKIIGSESFNNNINLSGKIDIPEKVETIGFSSFKNCPQVTSINLDEASSLKAIQYKAFEQCENLGGSVAIPANVTEIGYDAFYNCPNITEINLQNAISLGTIGANAFRGCVGVKGGIVIPSAVTEIGSYAFMGLRSITSINLSNATSLLKIGAGAFRDCSNVTTDIGLPESLQEIGESAFEGLSSVKMISFNNASNLEKIGNYAFYNCPNISKIYLDGATSLKVIGESAFLNCYKLNRNLIIPKSVTTIGANAFSNCGEISELVMDKESQLESIGARAFSGCSSINNEILIPKSVKTIGADAFRLCKGIHTITIESSNISSADLSNTYLTSYTDVVNVKKGLTVGYSILSTHSNRGLTADNEYIQYYRNDISNIIFSPIKASADGSSSAIVEEGTPNHVAYMVGTGEGSLIDSNGYITNGRTSLNIPATFKGKPVTVIGESAFLGVKEITKLNLTNATNIKIIAAGSFLRCENLTGELILPNSLTTIGNLAFMQCGSLSGELKIPNRVTSIGWQAFNYCTGITGLDIGEGVINIGDGAFHKNSFYEIYIRSQYVANLADNASKIFTYNDETRDALYIQRGISVNEDSFVASNFLKSKTYTSLIEDCYKWGAKKTVKFSINQTNSAGQYSTGDYYNSQILIVPYGDIISVPITLKSKAFTRYTAEWFWSTASNNRHSASITGDVYGKATIPLRGDFINNEVNWFTVKYGVGTLTAKATAKLTVFDDATFSINIKQGTR